MKNRICEVLLLSIALTAIIITAFNFSEETSVISPAVITAQNSRGDTLMIHIKSDSTLFLNFGDKDHSFFGIGKVSDSVTGEFECVEFSVSKSLYTHRSDKGNLGVIRYDSLPEGWTLQSLNLINNSDTTQLKNTPFISQNTELDLTEKESYDIAGKLLAKGDIFHFESFVSQHTSSTATRSTREFSISGSIVTIRGFDTQKYSIIGNSQIR